MSGRHWGTMSTAAYPSSCSSGSFLRRVRSTQADAPLAFLAISRGGGRNPRWLAGLTVWRVRENSRRGTVPSQDCRRCCMPICCSG